LSVWLPSARPLYVFGVAQATYAPPSRLHSNVEPVSVEPTSNVGEAELLGFAGFVGPMDVSGGTVSTVQV
jgi:hypothetical protein